MIARCLSTTYITSHRWVGHGGSILISLLVKPAIFDPFSLGKSPTKIMFFVILNNAKLGTVRAITIDLRIADLKYFYKFATNFSCFCLVKLNSFIGILVRDRL